LDGYLTVHQHLEVVSENLGKDTKPVGGRDRDVDPEADRLIAGLAAGIPAGPLDRSELGLGKSGSVRRF
jgi:hypothetical protein